MVVPPGVFSTKSTLLKELGPDRFEVRLGRGLPLS